jgi:hypothetical protein
MGMLLQKILCKIMGLGEFSQTFIRMEDNYSGHAQRRQFEELSTLVQPSG